MNKGYLVGGLAIVGAIALFAYLRPKPRRNSEGFFGASGGMGSGSSLRKKGNCTICYDNYSDSNAYQTTYYATNGVCRSGDKCKR